MLEFKVHFFSYPAIVKHVHTQNHFKDFFQKVLLFFLCQTWTTLNTVWTVLLLISLTCLESSSILWQASNFVGIVGILGKKISFEILSLRTFISCHHNLFLDCIIADNACFIWYLVKIRVHYPTEKAIGVIIDQNVYFRQFPYSLWAKTWLSEIGMEAGPVVPVRTRYPSQEEATSKKASEFHGRSNMIYLVYRLFLL